MVQGREYEIDILNDLLAGTHGRVFLLINLTTLNTNCETIIIMPTKGKMKNNSSSQKGGVVSSQTSDVSGIGTTRRGFFKNLILLLFGAEGVYLLFDFFKGNKKRNFEPEDLFVVGQTKDFESNRIYPFSSGKFYIYKFDDGGIIAISYRCTHLGCTIQYDEEQRNFVCPCHASAFNIKGEVLSPPATRPLDVLPVYIKNSEIKVDVNHPKKRKKFIKSQLTYA